MCPYKSNILRALPRKVYCGERIIDANGNHLEPKYVISTSLVLGTPAVSIQCEFLVIENLPFSCILGQSALSKFTSWSVNNVYKSIILNDYNRIHFYSYPLVIDSVQLITTNKVIVEPHESAEVNTRAYGSALSAFRPVTDITVLSDGNEGLLNRLQINILPSICVLKYQNCPNKITIYNNSSQRKTISKGTNIASGCQEFEEYALPKFNHSPPINSISEEPE